MLDREPLCRVCAAEGRTTAAVELDHIVPLHLGGEDTEANVQPLCRECHDAKSARERAARSRPRRAICAHGDYADACHACG